MAKIEPQNSAAATHAASKNDTPFIHGGGGQLHRLCHSQGGVALRCRLHRPALPSAAPPAFPSAGGVTLETSLSEALYPPMCWVWTARLGKHSRSHEGAYNALAALMRHMQPMHGRRPNTHGHTCTSMRPLPATSATRVDACSTSVASVYRAAQRHR